MALCQQIFLFTINFLLAILPTRAVRTWYLYYPELALLYCMSLEKNVVGQKIYNGVVEMNLDGKPMGTFMKAANNHEIATVINWLKLLQLPSN